RTLERIGATSWAGRPGAVLTGRGPAKSYLTVPATAGFFATLGVAAKQGRTFTDDDIRGGCAVVLSGPFWRSPLSAAPSYVGPAVTLNESGMHGSRCDAAELCVLPSANLNLVSAAAHGPPLEELFRCVHGRPPEARLYHRAGISRTDGSPYDPPRRCHKRRK